MNDFIDSFAFKPTINSALAFVQSMKFRSKFHITLCPPLPPLSNLLSYLFSFHLAFIFAYIPTSSIHFQKSHPSSLACFINTPYLYESICLLLYVYPKI